MTEFQGRQPCSVCRDRNCTNGLPGDTICVWFKLKPFDCQNLACKFISYNPKTGEFNCYLGFEQQCHAATQPKEDKGD